MKYFFLFAAIALSSATVKAQTTEDSVKAAVNALFDAMKNSDAAGIEAAFSEKAVLQTIGQTKEGLMSIQNEEVKAFASSIAKIKKGAADEQISFSKILIDGPLASVWTPYKFYYEGKFSHCGVNSFQMVRLNGGAWKIQYIIDTRRRTGCE